LARLTLGSRRIAAPRIDRSVRDFALLLSSTGTLQVSRLVLNLVAAATLPVAAFGTWVLIQALLLYTTYSNLGILSGANRWIPVHLGRGEAEAARNDERAALAGALLAGAVAALLLGGITWGWTANPALAFAVAVLFGFQQPYLFYQVSLRSRMEFDRASAQQLVLGLGLPVVGLPLLLTNGVPGLTVAFGVVYLAGSLIPWFAWRRSLAPDLDFRRLGVLMRSGIPIMISGLLFGVLVSLDRWIILAVLGEREVGVYALAATLSGGLQLVFLVLAQQFYPRIALEFGRAGTSPALFDAALRVSVVSSGAVLPFAVLLAAMAPIVTLIFPAYAGAAVVLPVLAIGAVVLAFSNGFTNLLVAVGRYAVLIGVHVAAVAVAGGAAFAAAVWGWGIEGVAVGMVAGFGALAITSSVAAWQVIHE
jgi:O-antigen/teichoic acid export membrane protein